MKLKKFLMCILGVAALASCSSEVDFPESPNLPDESDVNSRFMTVRIRNVDTSSTRAGGDQTDGYEEGLDYENKVTSVRFYFFDKDGKPYQVSYTGLSYVDCTEVKVAQGENDNSIVNRPYVEKQLEAMIVLTSTDPKEDFSRIKAMVAIANNHLIEDDLGSSNLSLADLKKKTGNYSVQSLSPSSATGQFLMTSSSFGASKAEGKDLDYGCEVEVIAKDHIKSTREEAAASPVEIYIERLVAKVRVTANWNSSMVKKTVVYGEAPNSKEYVAIQLKSKKKDNSIESITVSVEENGEKVEKNVYLLFNGWDLSGVVDKSYLFKKVSTDWDLGWKWNDSDHHRSYWATNPDGYDASHPGNFKIFNHENALNNKVGTKLYDAGNNTHISYDGDALYCLENAAESFGDGTKPAYDPDKTTRNRTVAYISGKLVTLDDENKDKPIAKDLDYAEWGGDKYTESSLIAAMFKPSENIIYVRAKDPYQQDLAGDGVTVKKYHYYPITVDNVELVNAETAGLADNITENSKRYLSFIILKNNIDVKDGDNNSIEIEKVNDSPVFYQKNGTDENGDVFAEITRKKANEILTSVPGAKVWRNGDVYYYVDLKHIPTNADADKGAYGVVRNHIYEVEINSLFGLGTPVLDPKEGEGGQKFPIDPQKPDKDAFFLGARINILSWRVVSNKVEIDW